MKNWKLFLLSFSLVWSLPVLSGEEAKARGDDKNDITVRDSSRGNEGDSAGEAASPSPIKRLVEMRLDEHVVAARQINLTLPGKTQTLQEIKDQLDSWADDEKVGGVLLDLNNIFLSFASVDELGDSIERMKKSGKRVTAFLNGGTPSSYFLACRADEIVIAPTGNLFIQGLGRAFPFMKGYFQQLGIEIEVITAGEFKYPGFYTEREPNEYFEEQYGAVMDSWFEDYKRTIMEHRGLSDETVSSIVDRALFNAKEAQNRGLVDTIAYYDECKEKLVKRYKLRAYKWHANSLANVNSVQDLFEIISEEMLRREKNRKAVGPKIAVLHARGPIIDINLGSTFSSQIISRNHFVDIVSRLRKNKSIKAVVLHIDSPGGSGHASDAIWHELKKLNEEKPLVVSMSSVAASGGYYIACPARRIFAHATTITGSIGVIGMIPSYWSQYNRADILFSEIKRGERSTLFSPHRTMKPEDRELIQESVDDFYEIFLDRVAQARRIPLEKAREIAEGRVYTGRDALEIGLIDELGGLHEAIEEAREMANIPPSAELKILHYPGPASFGEFFEDVNAVSVTQMMSAYQRATSPAVNLSWEQQIQLLTRVPEPLLWLAVPDLPLVYKGKTGSIIPELNSNWNIPALLDFNVGR